MSEILVLQHSSGDTLGKIADVLARANIGYRYVRAFDGEPVPRDLDSASGLIVMGGPMSVYEQDRYPFLTDEMRLIERALRQNLPVLGVCLGGQILASVLGADVRPGAVKEIGWYPVMLADAAACDQLWAATPTRFTAFHWHGDMFDLPHGAVNLASSEITACQAFRHGDCAYGVLFHMEVTGEMIREWASDSAEYLVQSGISSVALMDGIAPHMAAMREVSQEVFARWAELTVRDSPGA